MGLFNRKKDDNQEFLKLVAGALNSKDPVRTLLAVKIDANEIKRKGLNTKILKGLGYSAAQLGQLGFSIKEIRQANYPIHDLIDLAINKGLKK